MLSPMQFSAIKRVIDDWPLNEGLSEKDLANFLLSLKEATLESTPCIIGDWLENVNAVVGQVAESMSVPVACSPMMMTAEFSRYIADLQNSLQQLNRNLMELKVFLSGPTKEVYSSGPQSNVGQEPTIEEQRFQVASLNPLNTL
jgi:hypothetical protein